nr:uncharacterized mitochondrial protein AtMg00810-like [Tanacetum cinerariifolium]
MATKPKLDADLSGNPVDQTDYRSKIESLVYLTSSRPDMVQAVCFCARYQSRLSKKHLKEVKRIFRYLRGTVNMGLWYSKGSSFGLTVLLDSNHAGCIDSRKSTSGGIQFRGDKLVSWMSKKQNCTAMSSAEAEYVALSASCAQVMWMRTQLQDYRFNYNKIPLYCDSQSAIAISCNPIQELVDIGKKTLEFDAKEWSRAKRDVHVEDLTHFEDNRNGMSEGLKHGVDHGKAKVDLAAIEAYDSKADTKYVTAFHALKDLKYPLFNPLEKLKDAPIDVIMSSLYLESDSGEDASKLIRELRPNSS